MYAQTAAIKTLYNRVTRTHKDTFEEKADSMTNAFIESFMIKNKGVFNDKYQYYAFNAYWTQAHAIDVVIYNYQRHKNIDNTLANTYKTYMTRWYNNKANNYSGASTSDGTYRMFENNFTDDMCWISLSLMHLGEATGLTKYFTAAKGVFDNYIIKRGQMTEDSTGMCLPWKNEANSGPNACTQSPATLVAAKLYQKYGTEKYLDYAVKLFNYTYKNIIKYENGQPDGRVEEPPLTYTQGTFGEACRVLYHITNENKYKTLAYKFISYAFTSGRCTSGNNILRHEGTSGDQSIFKAVLIPYAVNFVLDESMTTNYRTSIFDYIVKNTKMMWQNLDRSRYPIVFCNYDWRYAYTGEDSEASMGAMCSGSSLMENTARMCRAIVDRYELGTLYTECSKYNFEDGQYGEAEMAAFNTAMANAQQILDDPSAYTTAQFQTAKNNLSDAYQAVLASKLEDLAIIDETPLFIQEEKAYPHITYTRTYDGNWESLYVPFAMKYEDWAEEYDVGDIFEFHQDDIDNDGIIDEIILEVTVLNDGETLPNRPYLIRAKSPGEKTLILPDATAVPTDNNSFSYNVMDYTYSILGYYSMLTVAQAYFIQNGELVYTEEEAALSPQRWCLSFYDNEQSVSTNAPARISILTREDYANGCFDLAPSLERDETIYDLSGRKISGGKLPRGIYIKGGRKIIKN